jgi:hypothetical protein
MTSPPSGSRTPLSSFPAARVKGRSSLVDIYAVDGRPEPANPNDS